LEEGLSATCFLPLLRAERRLAWGRSPQGAPARLRSPAPLPGSAPRSRGRSGEAESGAGGGMEPLAPVFRGGLGLRRNQEFDCGKPGRGRRAASGLGSLLARGVTRRCCFGSGHGIAPGRAAGTRTRTRTRTRTATRTRTRTAPLPRATTRYERPAEGPPPTHECARDPALPCGTNRRLCAHMCSAGTRRCLVPPRCRHG
jgi:hypothetical protein